jgi:hypothetical protein
MGVLDNRVAFALRTRPLVPSIFAIPRQRQASSFRLARLAAVPMPVSAAAAAVTPAASKKKKPAFPFSRIAGQEEMKLALMLNVVDSAIGGVLIMGDRGTGKSVAVRKRRRPLFRPLLSCTRCNRAAYRIN